MNRFIRVTKSCNSQVQFHKSVFLDYDPPTQPMPEMRYVDASARPGEKHRCSVITVNSVGLRSKPSAQAC